MSYTIGCDVGSQSLKGVLLDPSGRLAGEASRPYDLAFPRPGWAEQDPAAWLAALREVVRDLLEGAGLRPADVGTVGFASQVDGVVAVDGELRPLRPAIIWMDRRAESQAAALGRALPAKRVFALTGLNLDSSHVAPKILWLRDEQPEVFARSAAFLLPGSYVVAHLTGELVVDYSNASSTMVYDVRSRTWSAEMLAAADLDEARLGRIAPADEVAGSLHADGAAEIGLLPGTRVVVGCGDEHGACLGAGLVRPGVVCDITGTAEPVAVAAPEPIFDDTGLVETHAHADSRLWLIENPGFVSGGSIRWFLDNFSRTDYGSLDTAAALVPPGSDGLVFLPCLSGAMTPTWNGSARGVFYGLSMAHGVDHLGRAVFEGCAYGFRDIVDRFWEMGLGRDEIRVVGGGARSELWCQIKADVTGRPLRTLADPESTAVGAAMLAGVGEGTFRTLDEAAEALVGFGRSYEPDPATRGIYDEAYGLYRRLYATLEPAFWAEGTHP